MLKNLLKLLFPTLCYGCNELLLNNEHTLCSTCIHHLPYTNHHLFENNEILNKYYGILDIEFAFSMLYFNHSGIVQKLIHQLKYKGKQEIGTYFGEKYSIELIGLKEKHNLDFIIPVPIHKKRRKERGYNQIDTFCVSLSKELNIPFNNSLLHRNEYSKTQTRKNKQERQENYKIIFDVHNEENFNGKHFLLIDDVITTGATIELCTKALLRIPNAKVSVITIAYTQS